MKLYHGDCLQIMKDIPDASIDMVLTDPPYKTITGGDSDGKNSVRPKGMLKGNRKLFTFQNNVDHELWIREVYRVLKPCSHCYIFTNVLNLPLMMNLSLDIGFQTQNLLVWEKNNCTPSQYYMKNCEYVLFLRKGRAKYINDIGGSKTVHKFDNIIGHKVHPTEKPVDLLEFYIRNSSSDGDVVLDPFMGSGSTGVACVNTGRDFIGIELDEQYFNVAKERIDEVTK